MPALGDPSDYPVNYCYIGDFLNIILLSVAYPLPTPSLDNPVLVSPTNSNASVIRISMHKFISGGM